MRKLYMVKLNANAAVAVGGEFVDGYVQAELREFGDYALRLDTLPPELKTLSFLSTIKAAAPASFVFRARDEHSGLDTYNAYLNNEWVLLAYEAKTGKLSFAAPDGFKPGNYSLRIEVSDKKGNRKHLERSFQVK